MADQPKELNKVEVWGLKLIIARFKSKSPAGYALLAKYSVILAGICGAYIAMYNQGVLTFTYAGAIDNFCIVAGAALTAVGLVSGSTTTNPKLVSNELKQNVIQDAVDNKTHLPIGPKDN